MRPYVSILLLCASAVAQPLCAAPLSVDKFYIEYRNYTALRDPYFPGKEDWKRRGEFHFNLGLLNSRIYMENNLHLTMDSTQVREAGWEYTVGVRTFKWLDIVKYHHSRHSLEAVQSQRFPVEDSYGVRIFFIK